MNHDVTTQSDLPVSDQELLRPSGTIITPSIVEGVLQVRMSLEEVPVNLFADAVKARLHDANGKSVDDWVKYSARAIWRMREVKEQRRFGTLYQKGTKTTEPLDLDVRSMIDTALRLNKLSPDDADRLLKRSQSSKLTPEKVIRSHKILNKIFWGLHYIDYHLHFLEGGLYYGFLPKEDVDDLKSQLLGLDPEPLEYDDIVAVLRRNKKLDQSGYARLEALLQDLSISVGDTSISTFSLSKLKEDLTKIARSNLVIAPDFGNGQVERLRLIPIDRLSKEDHPEIIIEGLFAVTSYPGRLGEGNIIKTHSLFPGEKAVITVETYSKQTSQSSSTSSVLDSVNKESEDAFSNEVNFEDTYNNIDRRTNSFSAGANATATWGFASGGLNTEYSQTASSESTRTTKNINHALNRQVTKASSNRTVKVETSSTSSYESSSRQAIVRTIENINVSKSLNFAFRQLSQLYLSLTTIKDLRIVVRSKISEAGTVVTLEHCPEVLRELFSNKPERDEIVKSLYTKIIDAAKGMAKNNLHEKDSPFIIDAKDINDEKIPRKMVNPQLRFKYPPYKPKVDAKSSYKIKPFADDAELFFDGILLKEKTSVILTEGIVVECFLRNKNEEQGLDDYSADLQQETIKQKKAANGLASERVEQMALARTIVNAEADNNKKAELFHKLITPLWAEPPKS